MTGIKRLREFVAGISPVIAVCGVTKTSYDREHMEEAGACLRDFLSDIADQIERERACDADTIENVRLIVGGVVDEMESHCLGHEGMEDSPVARWARELREALGGEEHDPADDVSVSAYDLLPQEEREAIAWVREHGGLDQVKIDYVVYEGFSGLVDRIAARLGVSVEGLDDQDAEPIVTSALDRRLMPEGMEWLVEAWPRFEDSEPVRIGDEVSVTVHDEDGDFERSMTADSISFGEHGIIVCDPCHAVRLLSGERVSRPAPKVLDADGVEIRVGDTVYYVDGREQRVNTVARLTDDGCVQFGRINEARYVTYCEAACIQPNLLTHRAPVLAADGKPLREGETVWHKSGLACGVVVTIDAGSLMHTTRYRGDDGTVYRDAAKDLVHERPDSWERLEKDAKKQPYAYCVEHGLDDDSFPTNEKFAQDLVRRCRALAERDA